VGKKVRFDEDVEESMEMMASHGVLEVSISVSEMRSPVCRARKSGSMRRWKRGGKWCCLTEGFLVNLYAPMTVFEIATPSFQEIVKGRERSGLRRGHAAFRIHAQERDERYRVSAVVGSSDDEYIVS